MNVDPRGLVLSIVALVFTRLCNAGSMRRWITSSAKMSTGSATTGASV